MSPDGLHQVRHDWRRGSARLESARQQVARHKKSTWRPRNEVAHRSRPPSGFSNHPPDFDHLTPRPNFQNMNAPKARLKLVAPTSVNRTVPRRPKNKDLRTREHLTEKEVDRLIKAVRDNRYGHRDATMVLIAFRHGLRASELCDLRWDQLDFGQAVLHVRRAKNGTPSTHPTGP
jgi:integrase